MGWCNYVVNLTKHVVCARHLIVSGSIKLSALQLIMIIFYCQIRLIEKMSALNKISPRGQDIDLTTVTQGQNFIYSIFVRTFLIYIFHVPNVTFECCLYLYLSIVQNFINFVAVFYVESDPLKII